MSDAERKTYHAILTGIAKAARTITDKDMPNADIGVLLGEIIGMASAGVTVAEHFAEKDDAPFTITGVAGREQCSK